MKSSKAWILTFAIGILCFQNKAFSQLANLAKLEKQTKDVIANARKSSVFVNTYDPVRKINLGARASGVVVSADGIVLTAGHVNTPGNSFRITFPDGKEYMAQGLGKIASLDLGILKITEKGTWPYAEMGWSSSLKVNEPVISIAYPGSFMPKRDIIRFGYVTDLAYRRGTRVITTCLMEPGDSGGPVFDLLGRVVGLHSAIDGPLDRNYEIPVDLYRKYWTALQKPQLYTALPSEDIIPTDPLLASKQAFVNYKEIEPAFPKLETKFERATLKITSKTDSGNNTIIGTSVNLKGMVNAKVLASKSFLVSKNSMVGQNPIVDLGKGKTAVAEIIARDVRKDLVLLAIKEKLKGGIELAKVSLDTLTISQLGEFLISPQPDNEGEWSVLSTTKFNLAGLNSVGYLGARGVVKEGKVVVDDVRPNSPALAANLALADQIISINGVAINDPLLFSKEIQKNLPNDVIKLVRAKEGKIDTLAIKLGKRPLITSNHIAERFTDGKSDRRDGFDNAFVHDGKLKPSECGGPIFDIEGNFIGINMARFSRASSIAITVAEVKNFIAASLNF